MSTNYKTWSSNSTAAQKLIELFDLYKKTEGAAGVDHTLNSPKEIEEQVWKKYDFLSGYNPTYFSRSHFRKLRNTWLTARAKEQGRKRAGESDLTGEFIFVSFLFFSFVSKLTFVFK